MVYNFHLWLSWIPVRTRLALSVHHCGMGGGDVSAWEVVTSLCMGGGEVTVHGRCDVIVWLLSPMQTSIRRCKPRDAGPLDIAAINACLAEVGGKWLSWEQPVELPSAQWLPKMDPLPFPNQNRKETVEPISEDNQMPVPSHAHKHTEL